MCDSQALRDEFDQPDIVDGWEILAEGDGSGAYGYGSRDLLMYLRGPDGLLYCQEASCCSCNGIDGCFDPVETNLETIRKDLYGYGGEQAGYADSSKADICREAIAKITGGACEAHEDCRETPELGRACADGSRTT
jgi:hypothetical protein